MFNLCDQSLFNKATLTNLILFIESVMDHCVGEARDHLEMLCMKLPEKDCIEEPMNSQRRCGEYEFDCGEGHCIPGLGVCDGRYQCMNGADELMW